MIANSMFLGADTVEVIRPKVFGEEMLFPGGLKLGVLVKLKNSARKRKYLLSVTLNCLPTPKSQLTNPGALLVLTPQFPKDPLAGIV